MSAIGYPELIILAMMGFILLATAFWIWMLVDCLIHEPTEYKDKLMWVLIIVLTGWIGAMIYLFVRRPARITQFGR